MVAEIEITSEIYAAAIPNCCEYQTVEAHEEMMLCWGLMRSIREGREMVCGWCELNTEHTKEEHRAWLIEHNSKRKVWRILSGQR